MFTGGAIDALTFTMDVPTLLGRMLKYTGVGVPAFTYKTVSRLMMTIRTFNSMPVTCVF